MILGKFKVLGVDVDNPFVWQCVLVCWGVKYDSGDINRLVRAISDCSISKPKFVLITDSERDGINPDVAQIKMPEFWRRKDFTGGGCQAKLSIFESEVLDPCLPAMYVDLDTMVLGDLANGFKLLKSSNSIAIFQSGGFPIGLMGRLRSRLTGGRFGARANSSLIYFYPSRCHFIAEKYRSLWMAGERIKEMAADDRFIAWVAQDRLVKIPGSLAVKFPDEFMSFSIMLLKLRAKLFWVAKRRDGLCAITFNGTAIKPEGLVKMGNNSKIVDRRGRVFVWSDQVLGSIMKKIIDYYSS